jgi:hypothetical protein
MEDTIMQELMRKILTDKKVRNVAAITAILVTADSTMLPWAV